jgi:hypothetical protein
VVLLGTALSLGLIKPTPAAPAANA